MVDCYIHACPTHIPIVFCFLFLGGEDFSALSRRTWIQFPPFFKKLVQLIYNAVLETSFPTASVALFPTTSTFRSFWRLPWGNWSCFVLRGLPGGLGREGRPSWLRLGQFWGITCSAELLCRVRTLGFSLRSHPCEAFPPFLSHLARSPTSLSWEPFRNMLHRNLPLKVCSNLTSRISPQSLRAVPFYPGPTNTDTHRFPLVFPSPQAQHHILV